MVACVHMHEVGGGERCIRCARGGGRMREEERMASNMFGARIEGAFVADEKINPLVHLSIAIGGYIG
jgi:hypothetical protein